LNRVADTVADLVAAANRVFCATACNVPQSMFVPAKSVSPLFLFLSFLSLFFSLFSSLFFSLFLSLFSLFFLFFFYLITFDSSKILDSGVLLHNAGGNISQIINSARTVNTSIQLLLAAAKDRANSYENQEIREQLVQVTT
jgi:hypothetical protein